MSAVLSLCLGLAACGGSSGTHAAGRSDASTASAASPPASTTDQTASSAGTAAAAGGKKPSAAPVSGPTPPGDQDGDSPNNTALDKDDSFITTFGHAASPSERRKITDLVTRYYAAIASGDGATACSLLFFVFVESAAETYGQTSTDATAGRGKSCASVMSKVFGESRAQLTAENRALKVMAVRIQHRRAWVLLRFSPDSVRRLILYREGSSWKVGEALDGELV
ncbi:MAG: hypothetical protein ACTHM1_07415 [Solirubrobacteraceae bacterium]